MYNMMYIITYHVGADMCSTGCLLQGVQVVCVCVSTLSVRHPDVCVFLLDLSVQDPDDENMKRAR